MPRTASILLFVSLISPALPAQQFHGQVGRIDEAQLGRDWSRLRDGEFPIIPLGGVKVSVLDCDRPVRIQLVPIRPDGSNSPTWPPLQDCASIRLNAPLTTRNASLCNRASSSGNPGSALPWVTIGLTWLWT